MATKQAGTDVGVCDKDKPGQASLCSDYQPKPISNDLSYAFALTKGSEYCCSCYELRWTDGAGKGKRLLTQVISMGGSVDQGRQFIILTPGGGVGRNEGGCKALYGNDWYDPIPPYSCPHGKCGLPHY